MQARAEQQRLQAGQQLPRAELDHLRRELEEQQEQLRQEREELDRLRREHEEQQEQLRREHQEQEDCLRREREEQAAVRRRLDDLRRQIEHQSLGAGSPQPLSGCGPACLMDGPLMQPCQHDLALADLPPTFTTPVFVAVGRTRGTEKQKERKKKLKEDRGRKTGKRNN